MNLTSFVSSSHIFLSIYGFVISNISHQKKPSIPMLLALLWSFPLHSSSQPSQRPISNFRSITTVSPPGNSLALQYFFFAFCNLRRGMCSMICSNASTLTVHFLRSRIQPNFRLRHIRILGFKFAINSFRSCFQPLLWLARPQK